MTEFSQPLIYIDNQCRSQLSARDRGLAFGDGLFETMLVVNNRIILWDFHHDRLFTGLNILGIKLHAGQLEEHLALVRQDINKNASHYCVHKLMVTRGECGNRGYQIDSKAKPTLISQLFVLDKSPLKKTGGASVHICRQRLSSTPSWPGIKTLNQLVYVMATKERFGTSFDEGLLLSENGDLIEATSRNLFLVKNGVLSTPKLNVCGVAGTMRRLVIEKLSPKLGFDVREDRVTLEQLYQADEIFLTNSVAGVWPVVHCYFSDTLCREWGTGVISQKLQQSVQVFLRNGRQTLNSEGN